MSETDRLIQVAHTEIANHHNEADRLKSAAHELLNSAEWHLKQSRGWIQYAEQLVTGSMAEVITLPVAERRLTLLEGGQSV